LSFFAIPQRLYYLNMGKKQMMAQNVLGWHLLTDQPLRNPDGSVAVDKVTGQQLGVKAACNGGVFATDYREKRIKPTCTRCLAMWKAREVGL
jgi:hypothetical protein